MDEAALREAIAAAIDGLRRFGGGGRFGAVCGDLHRLQLEADLARLRVAVRDSETAAAALVVRAALLDRLCAAVDGRGTAPGDVAPLLREVRAVAGELRDALGSWRADFGRIILENRAYFAARPDPEDEARLAWEVLCNGRGVKALAAARGVAAPTVAAPVHRFLKAAGLGALSLASLDRHAIVPSPTLPAPPAAADLEAAKGDPPPARPRDDPAALQSVLGQAVGLAVRLRHGRDTPRGDAA